MSSDREVLERQLTQYHRDADYPEVAAQLVEGYGPEVVGFLAAMLGSIDDAQDVFQSCCEDLVTGLPGFRRESSFRTWTYVIARRRALKLRAHRRPHVALSQSPQVQALAEHVRTATATFRRTDAKDSLRALREELTEEERTLLVLRIDRAMDWSDVSRIMTPDADPAAGAVRLRKRFSRLKDKLRDLALESGLLQPEGQ